MGVLDNEFFFILIYPAYPPQGDFGTKTTRARKWNGSWELIFGSFFPSLFLRSLSYAIFFNFGVIFEVFWRPTWGPKSIFGRLLCELFFERDFVAIFG